MLNLNVTSKLLNILVSIQEFFNEPSNGQSMNGIKSGKESLVASLTNSARASKIGSHSHSKMGSVLSRNSPDFEKTNLSP